MGDVRAFSEAPALIHHPPCAIVRLRGCVCVQTQVLTTVTQDVAPNLVINKRAMTSFLHMSKSSVLLMNVWGNVLLDLWNQWLRTSTLVLPFVVAVLEGMAFDVTTGDFCHQAALLCFSAWTRRASEDSMRRMLDVIVTHAERWPTTGAYFRSAMTWMERDWSHGGQDRVQELFDNASGMCLCVCSHAWACTRASALMCTFCSCHVFAWCAWCLLQRAWTASTWAASA